MIFFRFNAAAPRSFIKQAIEIGLGALYLVSIFFATSSKWVGVEKQKFVSGFRVSDLFFSLFFQKSFFSRILPRMVVLWFSFVLFSFFSWSVIQESMSFFSFAFYSSLFPFVSSGDLLTRNWKFWSAASGWNLLSLIFSKKVCLSDKFGSDLRTRS